MEKTRWVVVVWGPNYLNAYPDTTWELAQKTARDLAMAPTPTGDAVSVGIYERRAEVIIKRTTEFVGFDDSTLSESCSVCGRPQSEHGGRLCVG